jgi:hypothetical protein
MEGIQKLYNSLNIKMIATTKKDGRNMQQELGRREMFERYCSRKMGKEANA